MSLHAYSKGQCTRAERQAPVKIEKDQNSILNWLSPGNFDIKHLETSGERLGGTGKWLMETLEFDNWIKGRPDYLLLWGCGIPGGGKTYLSSLVIDRLQMIKASSANYGLAYIYFDYIEKDRQGPIQVMASLIKQLSTQTSTSLPDETRKLYNKLKREEREPDFEELYRVFLATCGKFSRVFLVFDALDECDQDGGQGYLLRSLQHLLEEKQQISIFLTSQPYPEDIQRR
ncbi:hypothetical protein DFP73DRAFT_387213 [Morchella snyderi]|nr:hypothetical protein DFP73DRAFT_387213 [Morchella snyderi]